MDDYASLAEKIVLALCAVATAVLGVRQSKDTSSTNSKFESLRQARLDSQIEEGVALTKQLQHEREQRLEDAKAARARETDLVAINDAVRRQFEASMDEFRRNLLARDTRIGTLIEDIAEQRGRNDGLQQQIVDLQTAMQRQKSDDAEARRAITAGYERTIASLRTEVEGLRDRIHDLVNRHYGDGTATGILGPSD